MGRDDDDDEKSSLSSVSTMGAAAAIEPMKNLSVRGRDPLQSFRHSADV